MLMNLKECKKDLIYDLHNAAWILVMTSKHTNNQRIEILLRIDEKLQSLKNVMNDEVINITV